MATKAELQKKITSFEKLIDNPATSAGVKKSMQAAKAAVEKEIADGKFSDAEPPKKKDEPEKKEKEKPNAPAPKNKGGRPKKAKEEEFITVMVDGKKVQYNANDCDDLIAAANARKKRAAEVSNKSKSRLPSSKAADQVQAVVANIAESIPAKVLEEKPKEVKKAFEGLAKDFSKSLESHFDKLLSHAHIERISKAMVAAAKKEIEEIEKELKDKK